MYRLRKIFKKGWSFLSDLGTANAYFTLIGAPIFAGIATLWAWFEDQPNWLVFTVMPGALAGFLTLSILIHGWLKVLQSPAESTNDLQENPVYWSLAETLSWVAFGKAITAKEWAKKCISGGLLVRPQEETDSFNKAEHLLFEALRGKKICALGKKNESQQYEEVPPEYFLSDVSCAILHDRIDVNPENIGAMSKWDGPKWCDVRFMREAALLLWPHGNEGKVDQGPVFINAKNTSGAKFIGNVFIGTRKHIDVEGATGLEASSNVHRETAATVASETITKRSFDLDTQKQFVVLLKKQLPDCGTARIKYIALEFQPFSETIQSLFNAAGWQADVLERRTSKIPLVKVQGVGVAAYNKHYLDSVATIFKEVGVTDLYTEHRETGVPPTNPKWPTAQKTIYVYVGYVEK